VNVNPTPVICLHKKKYFSLCRTDSASADQDNLKYSSSRDRGSSASYGLQPSNSAVVSRQRHDDIRVHTDIQNEEKGIQICCFMCKLWGDIEKKAVNLKWWRFFSFFFLFFFFLSPQKRQWTDTAPCHSITLLGDLSGIKEMLWLTRTVRKIRSCIRRRMQEKT